MRIILYVMDGVSARKVRSYNSDIENDIINKNVPYTYLDKLYEKGFSTKNCYGFDTTQSSFYALMTGNKHSYTKLSVARNCNLLEYNRDLTLPALFKEKGFKTHYFSNNCVKNPAILLDGYEKKIYDYENYNLSNLDIDEDFDNFFGIDCDQNIFVTIHDFYTHDQNAQYSKGKHSLTNLEYEKLIIEHADILKNNLKVINFNEKKDYLFLISDHGMTVDSTVYKDKGDDESLWSLNSKELKSRVVCNILGPTIEEYDYKNVCSLREIFYTFEDKFKLSEKLRKLELSLLRKPLQKYTFSLSGGNAAVKRASRTTFHQFVCIDNNKNKWIYQDNINKNAIFFDLKEDILENNPLELGFSELPSDFIKYIDDYRNKRNNFSIKKILSVLFQYTNKNHIIHIFRNYKKIPKKLVKMMGIKK